MADLSDRELETLDQYLAGPFANKDYLKRECQRLCDELRIRRAKDARLAAVDAAACADFDAGRTVTLIKTGELRQLREELAATQAVAAAMRKAVTKTPGSMKLSVLAGMKAILDSDGSCIKQHWKDWRGWFRWNYEALLEAFNGTAGRDLLAELYRLRADNARLDSLSAELEAVQAELEQRDRENAEAREIAAAVEGLLPAKGVRNYLELIRRIDDAILVSVFRSGKSVAEGEGPTLLAALRAALAAKEGV